jgi:hypothetical protein
VGLKKASDGHEARDRMTRELEDCCFRSSGGCSARAKEEAS